MEPIVIGCVVVAWVLSALFFVAICGAAGRGA
jgi:hypothetical protein